MSKTRGSVGQNWAEETHRRAVGGREVVRKYFIQRGWQCGSLPLVWPQVASPSATHTLYGTTPCTHTQCVRVRLCDLWDMMAVSLSVT